jgi:hypothetical protein
MVCTAPLCSNKESMKKIILSLVFISGMLGIAKAQNNELDYRERLSFGIKIGANYSNVYDEQTSDFSADPKFGLAMGGFLSIPIGKYFGVQPELLFSQKGFKSSGSILGSDYSLTRTSNYIDVPLLFAFTPSEFLTIVAGPQYSYLISQKNVFANGSTSATQEQEFDNENIRKNTLCFTTGIDLTLDHSVVSLRAGWDSRNNIGDGSSTTLRYKNMWYQATIGYRL